MLVLIAKSVFKSMDWLIAGSLAVLCAAGTRAIQFSNRKQSMRNE